MFADTSIQDLKTILQGSIIRLKDEPFLVAEVAGVDKFTVFGYTLQDGADHIVALDEPSLNFEPVPLGFVPSAGEVDFFAFRNPLRQYRVGLNSENFSFSIANAGSLSEYARMTARDRANSLKRGLSGAKKNKQIYECITGVFPSVDKAFTHLEEGTKQFVALSRDFAMDKNFCLFFRTDMIGIITEEGVPKFARGRSYLQQFWEKINAGA